MNIEEIGTLEAKTNLSALLNQVLEGKSFCLTRRGKRVAELRPVEQPALSRRAQAVIEDTDNTVVYSIASVWEMSIKLGLGKLVMSRPL